MVRSLGDRIIRCDECGTAYLSAPAEPAAGMAPRCPMCRLVAPAGGRRRGVIKWYSRSKGYGFITPSDGPEVFLHKSEIGPGQTALRAGQLVEYLPVAGPRGIQAEQVSLLAAATTPDEPLPGSR
jgi:CspA family cold shock protein